MFKAILIEKDEAGYRANINDMDEAQYFAITDTSNAGWNELDATEQTQGTSTKGAECMFELSTAMPNPVITIELGNIIRIAQAAVHAKLLLFGQPEQVEGALEGAAHMKLGTT